MYTDKFGRDQVNEAFYRHQLDIKETLDEQAMKNYFYYTNDQIGIMKFLNDALGRMIKDAQTLALMPRVYVNEIPRLVKRLAMVYKTAPTRKYSKEPTDEQSIVLEKSYRWYKEFHRQAKLLNTVLVRPRWKEDKYSYEIYGRQFANVITDVNDDDKMQEVWYYITALDRDGKEVYLRAHWNESEYWVTDDENQLVSAAKYPTLEVVEEDNKYGRIPFAKLKLQQSNDFWGDGLSDAVNLNEQNNSKLCDSYYQLWMNFGYPIGVNLGVDASTFEIAPYKPIMVNRAKNDDQVPSLTFSNPNHQIDVDQDMIDYTRKISATSKGLPISGFMTEETELSGYAKQIDNMELMENNEDDKDALRSFEKDLFDLMVKESEVSGGLSFDGMELEQINFEPYEFPKTIDEENAEREFEYKFNMSTPVDWLREKNPSLSEEEASEILLKNRTMKVTLGGDRPSLLERVNGQQRTT